MLIYVLCGLISQSFLPVTEVCDYTTSALWRGGILDMSRGIKSKAVSGEKDSLSQDKSGSGDMRFADLFRMMIEGFDEQNRFNEEIDSHFEAFQEDNQNTNQRLQELQLRVLWPRLAGLGIQVGTSGELEEITTEARGRRIIPLEQQLLLPSQPPRLLPQSPMAPQPLMSQPAPQPPPPQLIAASPVSAATLITVFSWSTATSFTTFHDRNVKSPIARRYWS